MLRWLIQICLLLSAEPALANSQERLYLGLSVAGGVAEHTTSDVRQKVAATTGTGSFSIGYVSENGLMLGLLIESLALQGRDEGSQKYVGSSVGARIGWEWRRLSLWGDIAGGTLSYRPAATESSEQDGDAAALSYGEAGVGIGFDLYRDENLSLMVFANTRRLLIDADAFPHPAPKLRQELGLALNLNAESLFDNEGGSRSHSIAMHNANFSPNTTYLLLELTAELGRVAAEGLLDALLRIR